MRKGVENKAEQLGVGDNSNFSIVFHKFGYDKVLANTASSEPKASKFQSGHRVVKKVLNG